MAATYDATELATQEVNEVRLIIGDNTTNGTTTAVVNPKLQDEEIQYFLDNEVNVYMASAACAETLASRYTGMVRKSVGPLSVDYAEQAQNFASLASRLRERASGKGAGGAVPVFGGVSWTDKEQATDDPDFAGTAIRVGLMSGYEEITEPNNYDYRYNH